jgi:hypothetical protein
MYNAHRPSFIYDTCVNLCLHCIGFLKSHYILSSWVYTQHNDITFRKPSSLLKYFNIHLLKSLAVTNATGTTHYNSRLISSGSLRWSMSRNWHNISRRCWGSSFTANLCLIHDRIMPGPRLPSPCLQIHVRWRFSPDRSTRCLFSWLFFTLFYFVSQSLSEYEMIDRSRFSFRKSFEYFFATMFWRISLLYHKSTKGEFRKIFLFPGTRIMM